MKILLSVAFLGLTFSAFAKPQICSFDYKKEGSTLSWTAFKTPKKVGVGAKFSDFTITAKNAKSTDDLLASASFEINSQSIDSGDKGRDMKIAQFFFKNMLKGTKISGKVLKVSNNVADVEMTMNGATKVISMTSKFDEASSKLIVKGALDVLEFGMKDNLAAITKACYEKHEGVTWPNVDLELSAAVKKSCK
jgi:polyisoprenoid-binding protein YceI